jgi:hypothetical protein
VEVVPRETARRPRIGFRPDLTGLSKDTSFSVVKGALADLPRRRRVGPDILQRQTFPRDSM